MADLPHTLRKFICHDVDVVLDVRRVTLVFAFDTRCQIPRSDLLQHPSGFLYRRNNGVQRLANALYNTTVPTLVFVIHSLIPAPLSPNMKLRRFSSAPPCHLCVVDSFSI